MHVAFSPSELASQGSSPARRRSHFVPRCGSQPARNSRSWQLIPGGRLGGVGRVSHRGEGARQARRRPASRCRGRRRARGTGRAPEGDVGAEIDVHPPGGRSSPSPRRCGSNGRRDRRGPARAEASQEPFRRASSRSTDAAALAHRHCTAGLSPILSRSCACSTRLASSRASVPRWPRLSAGGKPTYPDRPSQARQTRRLPVGGLSHSAVVSSNGNGADATFPPPRPLTFVQQDLQLPSQRTGS